MICANRLMQIKFERKMHAQDEVDHEDHQSLSQVASIELEDIETQLLSEIWGVECS